MTEAPLPLLPVNTATSHTLSETLLIQADLLNCINAIRICAQISKTSGSHISPEDSIVRTSLFRDAIIQFVACFNYGKFLGIQDVYRKEDEIRYFNWLRDLRDSYAAHRHGEARKCIVGVITTQDQGVIGVGHILSIYGGPDLDGYLQLTQFIQIALNFIHQKISDLQNKFEQEVKVIPLDKIIHSSPARIYGLDPDNLVRPGRKKR